MLHLHASKNIKHQQTSSVSQYMYARHIYAPKKGTTKNAYDKKSPTLTLHLHAGKNILTSTNLLTQSVYVCSAYICP